MGSFPYVSEQTCCVITILEIFHDGLKPSDELFILLEWKTIFDWKKLDLSFVLSVGFFL